MNLAAWKVSPGEMTSKLPMIFIDKSKMYRFVIPLFQLLFDVTTRKCPLYSSIENWFNTCPGTIPLASYLIVESVMLIRWIAVSPLPSQTGCVRKILVDET